MKIKKLKLFEDEQRGEEGPEDLLPFSSNDKINGPFGENPFKDVPFINDYIEPRTRQKENIDFDGFEDDIDFEEDEEDEEIDFDEEKENEMSELLDLLSNLAELNGIKDFFIYNDKMDIYFQIFFENREKISYIQKVLSFLKNLDQNTLINYESEVSLFHDRNTLEPFFEASFNYDPSSGRYKQRYYENLNRYNQNNFDLSEGNYGIDGF